MLYTALGESVNLEGLYRDASCFLLCGGPSLASAPLAELGAAGVVTMAVNNAWLSHRPHLWTSVDRPGSFLDFRWRDPSILKIVPLAHLDTQLHEKVVDGPYDGDVWRGKFRKSPVRVCELPNVLFYRRNEKFDAASYLNEGTINWGCHGKVKDALGHGGVRSVMLVAIRLLHYLGFGRVYLLGCDFNMGTQQQYGFGDQRKGPPGQRSNNRAYSVLNARFAAVRPQLEASGMRVLNCTPGSGLTAFPQFPIRKALLEAVQRINAKPDSGGGWYDHAEPNH